ncbi:uncharacterized protein LOC118202669 [Stegodyphus dumicola]|uniref:uncharacterized protein LOC118202669 n=1 Tax=Stegodyphus dumicola TaxID=202533 RepID=UPI0015A85294|nr:uncharacterized protein LOC118202669 [Stegodyphus dumicola]
MSRSSNGTVYLQNTSLSAEGTYRCEVSADAPSFQSISSEKFMAVQERPPVTDKSTQLLPRTIRTLILVAFLLLCQ